MTDLIEVVGKQIGSAEVAALLDTIAPVRTIEAPPFRRYMGSPENGIDLVVEDDRVTSIQIYMCRTETFSAYLAQVPFGLTGSMNQDDVHRVIGTPLVASKVSSRYVLPDNGIRLVVTYDDHRIVRLVSLGIPD